MIFPPVLFRAKPIIRKAASSGVGIDSSVKLQTLSILSHYGNAKLHASRPQLQPEKEPLHVTSFVFKPVKVMAKLTSSLTTIGCTLHSYYTRWKSYC